MAPEDEERGSRLVEVRERVVVVEGDGRFLAGLLVAIAAVGTPLLS